jgi:uncharacterized RDD family membrane protein YckC
MGLMTLLFILPFGLQGIPELGKTLIPLGAFIIFFGYHLFSEWLWNGKTLGKNCFSIRVVRDDGQPIGFWEALGRNLLRVVDVYASGIGLVCMLINPQEKRFGDLLTGTIVINDQPIHRPVYTTLDELQQERERLLQADGTTPEPEAPVSDTDALDVRRLSAEEAEFINAYLGRCDDLMPDSRQTLLDTLCLYLSERLHQPFNTESELEDLLARYQQRLQAQKTSL